MSINTVPMIIGILCAFVGIGITIYYTFKEDNTSSTDNK